MIYEKQNRDFPAIHESQDADAADAVNDVNYTEVVDAAG